MSPESITYDHLFKQMSERALQSGMPSASLSNRVSALNSFMADLGYSSNSVIGHNLRSSYYRRLGEHVTNLVNEGRPKQYITNRKNLLGKWHALINDLDRDLSIQRGDETPFQTKLKEMVAIAGSQKRLAKETGTSLATLKRWISGTKPTPRALGNIRRLESYFAIEPGSLAGLVTSNAIRTILEVGESKPIEYRNRLAASVSSEYNLKHITEGLRRQWQDFLEFKVSDFVLLKKQPKAKWRVSQKSAVSESPANWYAFYNGKHVPTATITWFTITSYLGWLGLPQSAGGAGFLPEQTQSIAWFINKSLIHKYLQWQTKRSGGIVHGGTKRLIQFICALTHPKSGYLTQSPHLVSSLPQEAGIVDWDNACNSTYEWSKQALEQTQGIIKKSRDPLEPIRDVLELANPMEAVADMVRRMKSVHPTTGGLNEGIWARDLLLIKLLASNPLRANNMKLLTYKPDNTGELYQRRDGAWFILIAPELMKNEHGAARGNPYHMPVNESLWKDIEVYLRRYRPMFPHADKTNFFFLSSTETPTPSAWKNLNRRVFTLTKAYLWRCPGAGPHAFRYINGTSILKAMPGAWEVAAQVLHDREETVRRHYAHLRGEDGGTRAHAILHTAFERM